MVSMNMRLAEPFKQHAPIQCFPVRHALATAHNATATNTTMRGASEVEDTSKVAAIRECLHGKHMNSVAWCAFFAKAK